MARICRSVQKGLNDLDNHDVTHLEPDILECEINWALESQVGLWRKMGQQRVRWLSGITASMDLRLSKLGCLNGPEVEQTWEIVKE